jgi:hypothetical protein
MDPCRDGEHDWRVGPVVNWKLAVQVICDRCLDMGTLSLEESRKWPQWTDADAVRHSPEIEERYG